MSDNDSLQMLAPELSVLINGSELPAQAVADLLSASVHEDIAAAGMFTLRLANWDMNQLTMPWSDGDQFAPGSEVEIQMGYVDHLETLMVGEITGLEPEFSVSETPTLTVRGYDRRHRLMRGRKTRSFAQMKDSDIAQQIASDLGLTAQTEDTGVSLDYVLQHNQTDLEFLLDRATRIGYEVVVEDKTLYFRPHQHAEGASLTLVREQDLLEFYPRLTMLSQVGQVAVRGWSPKDKAKIVGEAGAGDETTTMGGATSGPAASDDAFGQASVTSVDRPVLSQAEADQVARGRFNDIALGYIVGEGVCMGRTDLRAGRVMQIDGVGERFGGLYYITATAHTYRPRHGYRTAFTVRRNAA